MGAGSIVFQVISKPIEASKLDGSAQTETAPTPDASAKNDSGAESYAKHCAFCHGEQLEGNLPAFPPLQGISHRMAENKIADMIHKGKGRMPGFPNVQDGELTTLLQFLATSK